MALSLPEMSTTERLRKGRHAIPSLLELQMMDVFYIREDFWGGAIAAGESVLGDATLLSKFQSAANGASSAKAAITAGANGRVLLDAGSDDNGRSDLSSGLQFRGDLNAHIWWRAQVSAVTAHKFELGFTDVVSGTDAGAINVKATPTYTATDAVVLCVDADDDTKLTLLGVKNGTGDTAIDFNTTLAAATDYYFGIELRGDQARGFLLDQHGRHIEHTDWMDDAVTETVLLTPWAFVQNRSASQRTMTIDMLYAYQRRTTA